MDENKIYDISKGASYATVIQMGNQLVIELLGDNPSGRGKIVESIQGAPELSMEDCVLRTAREAIVLRIGNQITINLAGAGDWKYGFIQEKNKEVKK